jgi:hypothetical protein
MNSWKLVEERIRSSLEALHPAPFQANGTSPTYETMYQCLVAFSGNGMPLMTMR